MSKESLEMLRVTVTKNIEAIQSRLDIYCAGENKSAAELDLDSLRLHHTVMRYAKLLMSIENRLASLK